MNHRLADATTKLFPQFQPPNYVWFQSLHEPLISWYFNNRYEITNFADGSRRFNIIRKTFATPLFRWESDPLYSLHPLKCLLWCKLQCNLRRKSTGLTLITRILYALRFDFHCFQIRDVQSSSEPTINWPMQVFSGGYYFVYDVRNANLQNRSRQKKVNFNHNC